MFINDNISSITCDCIWISYCDHYWRNGIRNGIRRCNCSDISCVIYNKVDIKEIKLRAYEKS